MTKRRRILTATLLTVLTVAAVAKVQLEPDPEFHADLENTLEWAYPPSWDDEQKFRELWLHHEKARELATSSSTRPMRKSSSSTVSRLSVQPRTPLGWSSGSMASHELARGLSVGLVRHLRPSVDALSRRCSLRLG